MISSGWDPSEDEIAETEVEIRSIEKMQVQFEERWGDVTVETSKENTHFRWREESEGERERGREERGERRERERGERRHVTVE